MKSQLIHIRNDEVRKSSMDDKTSESNLDEDRIFTVLKYLSTDYLLITKAKTGHFIVEALGRPHLKQVIKFNLSSIGKNRHHMPRNMIH